VRSFHCNGHSNSFSALLEMLDPQRFTDAVSALLGRQLRRLLLRRLPLWLLLELPVNPYNYAISGNLT
jgi:hypothetical protein